MGASSTHNYFFPVSRSKNSDAIRELTSRLKSKKRRYRVIKMPVKVFHGTTWTYPRGRPSRMVEYWGIKCLYKDWRAVTEPGRYWTSSEARYNYGIFKSTALRDLPSSVRLFEPLKVKYRPKKRRIEISVL